MCTVGGLALGMSAPRHVLGFLAARAATGWGFLLFFPSMLFFPQTVQDAWAGTAPQTTQLLFLAAVTFVLGAAAARLFRWEGAVAGRP